MRPLTHVCILATVHSPDDPRVTHKVGRALSEAGCKVSWLGFGATVPRESHGISFNLLGAHSFKVLDRLRAAKVLKLASDRVWNVDVWLGVEPDSAKVANRLRINGASRSIFDIHEMYHSDILHGRLPGVIRGIAGLFVKKVIGNICSRADLLIAPGATRIEPYETYNTRSLIVRHCLTKQDAPSAANALCRGSDSVIRIMHGRATRSAGTIALLNAVALVKRQMQHKLKVVLVEDFSRLEDVNLEFLKHVISDLGIEEEIEWHCRMSFLEMKSLMLRSDIGIIAYSRKLGENCIPNRLYEYLAFGLPIICPSYGKEVEPVVSSFRCGLAVDTEDPEVLAGAIRRMIVDRPFGLACASNARRAFEESFNMDNEIMPLINWIQGGR